MNGARFGSGLVGVKDDDVAQGAGGGVELGEDVVVAGNGAGVEERDWTTADAPALVRMKTHSKGK